MSKQKYTFPGPFCPGCQYHQLVGCTRYCNGFPKKRKPQQFRKHRCTRGTNEIK